MGTTKKEQYSKDQLNSARIGTAIASPARIAILQQLKTVHFVGCREVSKLISLSETTVQQHMQILVRTQFICDSYIDNRPGYMFTKQGEKDVKLIDWVFNNES